MVLEESRTLDDAEVVDRVRAGQTGLYELLMRRYNQRVYRVIRSILPDDLEAEDVLQETWVRAYQHLDQFRGQASIAPWVTKIAIYEAMARGRKSRRWLPLEDSEGEMIPQAERQPSKAGTPETQAMLGQLRQILEAAVERLAEPYRAVFVMREVEQLSTAETAECLGLSEEAVKTRLHRSRACLRRELEQRAGPAIADVYSFLGTRCDRTVSRVRHRIGASAVEPERRD